MADSKIKGVDAKEYVLKTSKEHNVKFVHLWFTGNVTE